MTDRDRVEWFHRFIGNPNPISVRPPCPRPYHSKLGFVVTARLPQYTTSLSSHKLGGRLLKIGMTPRKSFIDFRLPLVPVSVFWDFIRGVVDGDGSVGITRSRSGSPILALSITSNAPSFRRDLRVAFANHGVTASEAGISLTIRGASAEILCDRMYSCCPGLKLQRKSNFWDLYRQKRALVGGLIKEVGPQWRFQPRSWHEWLGKTSDSAISLRFGVARDTVRRARHKLGVPAWAHNRPSGEALL
jgi:hypothetical protein